MVKRKGQVLRGDRTRMDRPCGESSTRHWERIYNTVRPHQALGYRTPAEFLRTSPQLADLQCVSHVLDEYIDLTERPERAKLASLHDRPSDPEGGHHCSGTGSPDNSATPSATM
jgi:hypothetical protein